MKMEKIYFNPDEVKAIALGLGRIIDDYKELDKTQPYIPWTPEARKMKVQILNASRTAAAKLEKFTGIKCDLPEYQPGDEDEFLTKES